MDTTGWDGVAAALEDVDFPANKQDLVNHVRHRQADDRTVRLVRAMPLGVYRNISEVRSSVRLNPAADDGLDASQTAARARSPHSGRIAQHLREPQTPGPLDETA